MPLKVFVSSTYVDLKAHRAHVIRQLGHSGIFAEVMENWPAESNAPDQACLERLATCDLVVALIGFRRGYVPPGFADSITQLECKHAKENNIDVLPFLLADEVTDWPKEYDERSKDPLLIAWRREFRPHAGSEHTLFRSLPESLDVLPSIFHWHNRRTQGDQLARYLKCVREAHSKVTFLGLPSLTEHVEPHITQLFVMPAMSIASFYTSFRRDATTPIPLETALSQHRRLVILGDPGSGKSTLISWIAYHLSIKSGKYWGSTLGDVIPMVFVLRDLNIARGITWDGLVGRFLTASAHNTLSREGFEGLLRNGRSILLFDGLDEIGDIQTRRAFRMMVHRLMDEYPKTRWVLTSRVVGYEDVDYHVSTDLGAIAVQVAHVGYIDPFSDNQIQEFAAKWYAIRENDRAAAVQRAEDLVRAINRDEGTKRLARTPNLLTLMALVHRQKADLPHGKALLYDDIAEAYLQSIDEYRKIPGDRSTLREKKRWLGYVAYQVMLRRVEPRRDDLHSSLAIDGEVIRQWLGEAMREGNKAVPDDYVAHFLNQIKQRSGLVLERAPDRFTYIHLSFLEYFAAVYLKIRFVVPGSRSELSARLRQYAGELGWQETMVFLFEVIADECPEWIEELTNACFDSFVNILTGGPNDSARALFLTRLALNPHSGWSAIEQQRGIYLCASWALSIQQSSAMDTGAIMVLANILGTKEDSERYLPIICDIIIKNQYPYLNLTGCHIANLDLLSSADALRWLSLRDTNITTLEPLAKLHLLQVLSIQNTYVDDINPLKKCNYLEQLVLLGTQVSEQNAGEFKKTHQRLKITM